MSLNWINQNKSLYKDFTVLTSSLDDYSNDINGGILLQAYNTIQNHESDDKPKLAALNNILICFLISYYYDDLNNIQYMIQFINRIIPNNTISETFDDEKDMWKVVIRCISLGKIPTATSTLNKFLQQVDESTKKYQYYNMLLRLMENYPLPSIDETNNEDLLKNWKTLMSEFHIHLSNGLSEDLHTLFYLTIGILNGNETSILRINEVLDDELQHWGPVFLSFFMYYIPSMTLVDDYLKKSQKDEAELIYNEILKRNNNKVISYTTIIIDLDDLIGFSLLEILNRLNILPLENDFMNLLYDTWYDKCMGFTITKDNLISIDDVSVLLKIVCQSGLTISKKRKMIENITYKFITSNNQILVSLNNNDVEYLIGLFSKFRLQQCCKSLYMKLGLALINNITLNIDDESGDAMTIIGTQTILNGLSILSRALDYETEESFLKSNVENDVLSTLVGKCDLILECNLKRYLTLNFKDDPFEIFVKEYTNMNNLLKQAFIMLIIVKELEKTCKEIEQGNNLEAYCTKAMKYIIELLKAPHLKSEFKGILTLYFLNPLIEQMKDMQNKGNNVDGFETLLYEVLEYVNVLNDKYEKEIDLQKYLNNIVNQYKMKYQGESIKTVSQNILELLLIL
ncbi:uncharacterized protein HGUI_01646 [Hanseniaspora guilliermondii]|uniref:Nuclear pore complex protein Nup85 n=1 Tax=Hanseniaspora guilliermondii TaxID=56406 RepID=A0A1L0FIL7_9ASCO|nr:uncharacterized protein HGUI_01646 [Hanseniaspora guilliermondii]